MSHVRFTPSNATQKSHVHGAPSYASERHPPLPPSLLVRPSDAPATARTSTNVESATTAALAHPTPPSAAAGHVRPGRHRRQHENKLKSLDMRRLGARPGWGSVSFPSGPPRGRGSCRRSHQKRRTSVCLEHPLPTLPVLWHEFGRLGIFFRLRIKSVSVSKPRPSQLYPVCTVLHLYSLCDRIWTLTHPSTTRLTAVGSGPGPAGERDETATGGGRAQLQRGDQRSGPRGV